MYSVYSLSPHMQVYMEVPSCFKGGEESPAHEGISVH